MDAVCLANPTAARVDRHMQLYVTAGRLEEKELLAEGFAFMTISPAPVALTCFPAAAKGNRVGKVYSYRPKVDVSVFELADM